MIDSSLLRQDEVLSFSDFSSEGLRSNGPCTLKNLFFFPLSPSKEPEREPSDTQRHQNERQHYFGSSNFKPGSHYPTQGAPQV